MTDLERRAIALAGIKNWSPVIFRKIDRAVLVTGAVCPPYMRGPRKGEPNWQKRDRATERTVAVPCVVQ